MSDCTDTQQQQKAKQVLNHTKALAPLHRLAKHRLWDEIIGILQFEPEAVIVQWLQRCQAQSRGPIPGGTPLHVVLFFQPPLKVVDLLVKTLRRMLGPKAVPEDSIDPQRSQTPLHIAVATGCDYMVVDRLTTITAAQTVDTEGRTPLHWACTSKPFPDHKTIKLLVAVYPGARKLADNFEFTPLMIAQYHRAKKDILHLLKPTTHLRPPRDNENGEIVVVDEDDGSTSFVPEDLPMVVTLGKSFGDISCLHNPPEIEQQPRRAGKKDNPKEQKQPPSSPGAPPKDYIADETKNVKFQPDEGFVAIEIEDEDDDTSPSVPEDVPEDLPVLLVSLDDKCTNFGEISCLDMPEMDGKDKGNEAPSRRPTGKRPNKPKKQQHQKRSPQQHPHKSNNNKKKNISDDLSKAGESSTSSKRSTTRSSSTCTTPEEKYQAVDI